MIVDLGGFEDLSHPSFSWAAAPKPPGPSASSLCQCRVVRRGGSTKTLCTRRTHPTFSHMSNRLTAMLAVAATLSSLRQKRVTLHLLSCSQPGRSLTHRSRWRIQYHSYSRSPTSYHCLRTSLSRRPSTTRIIPTHRLRLLARLKSLIRAAPEKPCGAQAFWTCAVCGIAAAREWKRPSHRGPGGQIWRPRCRCAPAGRRAVVERRWFLYTVAVVCKSSGLMCLVTCRSRCRQSPHRLAEPKQGRPAELERIRLACAAGMSWSLQRRRFERAHARGRRLGSSVPRSAGREGAGSGLLIIISCDCRPRVEGRCCCDQLAACVCRTCLRH